MSIKVYNLEVTDAEVYACDLAPLTGFIVQHGIDFTRQYYDGNGNLVSVFILDDKLENILVEWTRNKSKEV